MSGIEIAGLVLGAFPVVLSCLESYREGFEPLEDWWNFRTHFIAFTDDVRHQMMRYNENLIRLLDPIITDSETLTVLVGYANDPRWTDGSLSGPLEQRLASEHGRFLRIIQRMECDIGELKKLMGMRDDNVNWLPSESNRSWDWHLKRLQISFSKGKAKKVRRLADRNQELEQILGYSERVIPIADKRKSSEPVAFFEKLRQHACAMHNVLSRNWICSKRSCRTHQASLCLRAETKTISSNILFVVGDEQEPSSKPTKEELIIKPLKEVAMPCVAVNQLAYVKQAEGISVLQERLRVTHLEKKSSFRKIFSKSRDSTSHLAATENGNSNSRSVKQTRFVKDIPGIIVNNQETYDSESNISVNKTTSQRIADLCMSLQSLTGSDLGVMVDEFDRQYSFLRPEKTHTCKIASDNATLVPLPKLLNAYHKQDIDISRNGRFKMAAHIASALLQVQISPWIPSRWTKDKFLFLADSQSVCSDYPYISQAFEPGVTRPPTTDDCLGSTPSISEEDTRAMLFTVGVIILELIFGHNIEDCRFRRHYYGPNQQPNDQTDISTARKWSQKVLGECGVEIDDVVRRCLDCSFGPRPNLQDTRFREAVYEGVISPLIEYLRVWQPKAA